MSHQKTPKQHKRKQRKKPEVNLDPYAADDEDDEYLRTKRHNDNFESDDINDNDNRIVMKVVKQGDYRHKQIHNQRSGSLGDIEQEFFLPRNKSSYNLRMPLNSTSSLQLRQSYSETDDSEDENEDEDLDEITDTRSGVERGKTKAVFEVPRKPISNYSKWSRWSRCSTKCVTRRFKKCRPHAKPICGSDIIREIAYCYTEGSFCEEWIHSQITKLSSVESTTTTTTTKAPRSSRRRTESPLSNAISSNFYGSSLSANKRKDNSKAQNLQCGFPSIRSKNNDFTLKIIGGKVARRGAWPWQVAILNRYKEAFCGGTLISSNWVLTGDS